MGAEVIPGAGQRAEFPPGEFDGTKLRQLREAAELTQKQLADLAGLSLRYMTKIESGRSQPTYTVVVKLAAALGCELSVFMRDTELAS